MERGLFHFLRFADRLPPINLRAGAARPDERGRSLDYLGNIAAGGLLGVIGGPAIRIRPSIWNAYAASTDRPACAPTEW